MDTTESNVRRLLETIETSEGDVQTSAPHLSRNYTTVDPSRLNKVEVPLPSAIDRKRKRTMSNPEGPRDDNPYAKRRRESEQPQAPQSYQSEGRFTGEIAASRPRYPRIFNPEGQATLQPPPSNVSTPGHLTIETSRKSSVHSQGQTLQIPSITEAVSWSATALSVYAAPTPRRLRTDSPALQTGSFYQQAWSESAHSPFAYSASPHTPYQSMPTTAATTTSGTTAAYSPAFSPQNTMATLQPLRHSATLPSYGPIGTSSYDPLPYQMQKSATFPTSYSATERSTASVIQKVTSEQQCRNSALPSDDDEPAGAHDDKDKPRCWEHGCNGRVFSTFSNLLRHQREKAGKAQKSNCPSCGAEFTRTTARNSHLRQAKCKPRRGSNASNATS